MNCSDKKIVLREVGIKQEQYCLMNHISCKQQLHPGVISYFSCAELIMVRVINKWINILLHTLVISERDNQGTCSASTEDRLHQYINGYDSVAD